ncbi:Ger(x)C family spore germination protein [Ectobacillus ponti]|uniref:Ger(X)C family spore germination protein n=1 Tax=Ectobacillus ponti TaxID=2961894 RepID=A0AA42BQC5_9BACI|nr:Ger(x)C family spore germination protein [Ectobacillus ponti]MCP8969251.1 Ger(x)C family spore germination protein [Ectobacillus ponti]
MRLLKCVGLLLLLLPLSACGDRLELEQQAYVVVMGLDRAEGNLIRVTFQVANPQVGSTDRGSAPNEAPSDIVTFTAPDILSAKDIANSVITRRISFAHLQTMIIGEKLARTQLFHHIMADSIRDPEMRREMNLMVCREKAESFIKRNKPEMETRPHKYYSFMQKRWKDTGFVPYSTMNRYFQRVGRELFLAIYATTKRLKQVEGNEDGYEAGQIPQRSGDPVQMMGSAVFKEGRMVGTMTGEETRYALLLRRRVLAKSFIMSIQDPLNPRFRVSFRVIRSKSTSVSMDVGGERPIVKVRIPLKVQVHSVPSLLNYESNEKNQQLLKKSIQKELQAGAMDIIRRTQTEFQGEPFIWYTEVRRYFRTLQQYEAYDWEKHYTKARVHVDFDLDIESFGKQLKSQQVSGR